MHCGGGNRDSDSAVRKLNSIMPSDVVKEVSKHYYVARKWPNGLAARRVHGTEDRFELNILRNQAPHVH
jgi:hypothetical protein